MHDALPLTGSHQVLEATYMADPGAVRAAILRAFQTAGGQRSRAAEELGLEPFVLEEWVRRLALGKLIDERWPEGK